MKSDDEERIRRRAHELWERAGRPEGDALKHWFQATGEFQTTKTNGDPVRGDSGEPAVAAKAKKPGKPVAGKQPGSAPRKRSTVSGTAGDKKGKRTDGG